MISGLQHFAFCRRQWALIHVEQQWEENYLTSSGNIVHKRVHDASVKDFRDGILTIRGLNVKSDKLGLTGTCDAVEFIPAGQGISLNGYDGFWNIRPVEYKRGSAKTDECDRLQVTAQAICLEEMFGCEINEAHIFYNETRRREKIPITAEMRDKVTEMCTEMHEYYLRGYTPRVKPSKACHSCSLFDLCLPNLLKTKNKSVQNYMSSYYMENE